MNAQNWQIANQRYLSGCLARTRSLLEHFIANTGERGLETGDDAPITFEGNQAPALEHLAQTFNLSPFEREILLLCAGKELERDFAPMCAKAHGDPNRAYPTFGLAMAVLPRAHWSALSPSGPLRHWHLIELRDSWDLTMNPIRLDERILNYLAGVHHFDQRLRGIIEPHSGRENLVASHRKIAEALVASWLRRRDQTEIPVIQLCGIEYPMKRDIAADACRQMGFNICILSANAVPNDPAELDTLLRRWRRESILTQSVLFLECDSLDSQDHARENAVSKLIENTQGYLVISTSERRSQRLRTLLTFDVDKPTFDEQCGIWDQCLDQATDKDAIRLLAMQFNLSAPAIRAISAGGLGQYQTKPEQDLPKLLWHTCRLQARPKLDDLAQRIDPVADWSNLILPDDQRGILHQIISHVKHRAKVYKDWGFSDSKGLGISALFAGSSGTGKTMAAEVLANEMDLDLYRIDLSTIISKYIGETEKNLSQVFNAAESGGAILLFDEADALFGKRSQVKDSHDRYANIEVSYLLQRMENYRGLAILTTNLKDSMDTAFLRRLRFIVEFPFPDMRQRAEIWRNIFPSKTPTRGLDYDKLARLNVAGGNIRNIALNAMFLAAGDDEAVTMRHLLKSTMTEYDKLEKPLTGSEIQGWET